MPICGSSKSSADLLSTKRPYLIVLVMAFKPERPTPFNEMAHLDPETAKYALALRETKKDEEEDWMAGLTDEERAIIEEENKKKKSASRMKPCKVKDCVKTEQEVGHQILERASLIKKIDTTEEKVKECADDITSLMSLSESTEMQLDKLTTTLAALKTKEKKEIKEKLVSGRKTTNQLENQIIKYDLVHHKTIISCLTDSTNEWIYE